MDGRFCWRSRWLRSCAPAFSSIYRGEPERVPKERGDKYAAGLSRVQPIRPPEQFLELIPGVTRFLARWLKLKVNEANSAVARPIERKLLGFSFRDNKEPKRRIAPKALLHYSRTNATDMRDQSGANAEGTSGLLKGLEELLRFLSAHLRTAKPGLLDPTQVAIHDLWKQWKREVVRFRELLRRDVSAGLGGQGRRQCARSVAPG